MQSEYDYIVVGGGTSGIVTAVRLAQAGAQVCLVEAGPRGEHDPRISNYRLWTRLLGTEYDYDYPIVSQAYGNSQIRHSRARVLGGCSAHNSVIALRSPDSDLRRWEAEGASGWGPEGTARYFERVFARVAITIAPANPCAEAFCAAAQQAGFPAVDLRAERDLRLGVGRLPLNVSGAIRQSSAVAYLFPLAPGLPNLTVLTDTTVRELLIAGGAAVGVQSSAGPLRARAEVILAAGAFDSPRLLLRSGIGPAAELRALGLPVRADLPAVGAHLEDHIETLVMWEPAQAMPAAAGQAWEDGIFASSEPDADTFDIMMHFGTEPYYVDFSMLGVAITPPAEAFCLSPNVARPRSHGSVRLNPADLDGPARIDPAYFSDPEGYDERVLVAGVRLARAIVAQPAMRPWLGRELLPGPALQSDAELGQYVRRASNTVYHPGGTCRMGAVDAPTAVVDPSLRVRGVDRLRVADAAVFPSMIGVNPCITCMMIGEKCAALILGEE